MERMENAHIVYGLLKKKLMCFPIGINLFILKEPPSNITWVLPCHWAADKVVFSI